MKELFPEEYSCSGEAFLFSLPTKYTRRLLPASFKTLHASDTALKDIIRPCSFTFRLRSKLAYLSSINQSYHGSFTKTISKNNYSSHWMCTGNPHICGLKTQQNGHPIRKLPSSALQKALCQRLNRPQYNLLLCHA